MKRWAIGLVVLFGLSFGLVSPAADFDGDGTDDIGIFRPSAGLWAVRGVTRVYFGGSGDNPAPGDYNGDGTDDIAVSRPGTGLWAVRGVTRAYFGGLADITLGASGGRWLPSGSNIYYNSGRVGVGTTNPGSDMDVWDTDDAGSNATLALHGSGANSNSLVEFWESAAIAMSFFYDGGDNALYLQDETQDEARVTFERGGNVGIGTTDPSERLTVKMGGYTWSDAHFALEDYNSTDKWDFIVGGSNKLFIGYNENSKITAEIDGDVGIGTTTPGAKLHVYGNTSQPGLVVRGGSSGSPYTNDLMTLINGAGVEQFWFNGTGSAGAKGSWGAFSPYISMHFIPDDQEKDDYEIGDVVSAIDRLAVKTKGAFDQSVVGVICPPEGFISIPTELKQAITEEGKTVDDFTLVPVAYVGDVQVKVNNEGGSIKSGDLIVPSSVPGEAMKGQPETFKQYASVIGKARENFDEASGLIWVSVGVK